MEQHEAQRILERVSQLDQRITEELQDAMTHITPIINQVKMDIQSEVDALTEGLNQLGDKFRQQLREQFNHRLGHFSEQLLNPAQDAINGMQAEIGTLDQQIQSYIQQLTQPIETITDWESDFEEVLDEIKVKVTETIEDETQQFIEVTTEISDTMLDTLRQQLQHLAAWLEQWVNEMTGLGDKELQQALREHGKTLTDQITKGINQLLQTMLERFDHYLQLAKQTLLDAVNQGSATREAIEPALEQLEVIRKSIEVVIEQVKELAAAVGIDLADYAPEVKI